MEVISESVTKKSDHFYVEEDPARIYRGIKDILVDELGVDRIEEAKTEFSVKKPTDKIRLHAFKEKSRNTVIHFRLNWRSKRPRHIYQYTRTEDILKARTETSANVVSVYPGGNPITWIPRKVIEEPNRQIRHPGLQAEHLSAFQKSKLYDMMVRIWHNKLYAREIQRYSEEAEESVIHLQNLMREKFGAEESISRSGRSEYDPKW